MRKAWSPLRAPSKHFQSHDLINVILGKTAITPSFFKLKTSAKNLKDP